MKRRLIACQQPRPDHCPAWRLFQACCLILALGLGPRAVLAQGLALPPAWNLLGEWDVDSAAPGSLPTRFVWTELFPGKPARDQGSCGSCWAHATVGVLEYQVLLYERRDVNLSEQWLIDCVGGGNGCNGGFQMYNFFMRNPAFPANDIYGQNGAVMEDDCPYTFGNGTCAGPYTHHYWLSGWAYIGFPLQLGIASRDQLKRAIYLFGPISSSVYAGNWPSKSTSFTGVLRDCKPDPANHMVMIVGWSDALQAWRIRNSWGSQWGDNGEAWIGYECSWIGFAASYVHYPTGRGVYVDFDYTGGENGLFHLPFNTLFEGVNAVDAGRTLNIKAGSTSEKLVLAKAMTLRAYGGTVTLGR